MPPWKVDPAGHRFIGLDPLSDAEIDTLQRWVADGAREGDRRDLPTPPRWSGGWQLGQPDLVVTLPAPFVLPAEGPDVSRVFVLPLPVDRQRYVRGIEFRAEQSADSSREHPHRRDAGVTRARRSRTRRPATTASSCVRRYIPTGISSDGRRARLLLFCLRGSRGRSRREATSSCSCTSCPAENRS